MIQSLPNKSHSDKSRHSRESGNPVISRGSGSSGQEAVSRLCV